MWFSRDQFSTDVIAAWALLRDPLGTVSAIDVSSTYFQMGTFGTLTSLIISKKSQGPSLVIWGTPEGTDPQSEKQVLESFTRWFRSVRKSVNQFLTQMGKSRLVSFWTRR